MFIRAIKKQRSKDAKVFVQYTLAQTSRVDGKVKQFSILYLGSEKLLADKANRALVLDILKSKIFGQKELFPAECPQEIEQLALRFYEKYLIKYELQGVPAPTSIPPAPNKAEYHQLNLKGMEVADVRSFGAEHLCKQVLEKLELEKCLKELGLSKKEITQASIGIIARAIFTASEHKTAQILEINSELQLCYRYDKKITHKQLYAIADKLFENKDKIDQYLYNKVTDMFDLKDKLVIFDISNTYFETSKRQSKIARHGRSKEKRTDCPLVVFTGVINAEGFIRHSRIYEGNTADSTTLEDMLLDLAKFAKPNIERTVVIDAGIATEDNLALLQAKHYKYVCVSRKRLKDYPIGSAEKMISIQTKDKDQKVSLSIFNPQGYTDTWMYVQSEAKRRKEQSMEEKLSLRYEEHLETIKSAIDKKRGTKKIERVWERIGRAKQKHNRISAQYNISISQSQGLATQMSWVKKEIKIKEDKSKGVYFLRTNYSDPTEKQLWDIYNTIREVESTFRCLKSDLQIRPVHHQNDERIKSHIYLTILAYQLVNTIRYMLKQKGLNYDWKNILRILNTHTIQTVILPTDKKVIHLRIPSKPIEQAQKIYHAAQCSQTQTATKKYVVYH